MYKKQKKRERKGEKRIYLEIDKRYPYRYRQIDRERKREDRIEIERIWSGLRKRIISNQINKKVMIKK